MSVFLTILSAIMLGQAFPKHNLFFLAWIALVPFLYSIEKSRDARSAGKLGLLFGLVFFSINLYWLNTLAIFIGSYAYTSWISLCIFQTAFVIVFAYFSKKLHVNLTIWQAFLWIAIEYVRSTGAFGLPCGVIAYSQSMLLPLIQISRFGTVYSISFIIILTNIAIARFIVRKDYKLIIFSILLIVLASGFGYYELNASQQTVPRRVNLVGYSNSNIINISIIQGNIPHEKQLDASHNEEIFNIHENLSLQAKKDHPQIVIWPESTIYTYLLQDNYYLSKIKKLAKELDAYMIIGSPKYDEGKFYNSIIVFSPTGEIVGDYDKQHLVPFGEYFPLKPILSFFLKNINRFGIDFSVGPNHMPIKVANAKIGTLLCFESTFPGIVREKINEGSDFILVLTNDSWFKNSSAPYDHANYGIFRAIENRTYFVQCANTGISEVVDPFGHIIKKLDLNTSGILSFQMPLR